MAEENLDHQAPAQVTPASNQNLIVGIVMGAVVLLLLLLLITQHFNKNGKTNENPDIAELKKELNERKARKEALRYAGAVSYTHLTLPTTPYV